MTDQSSDWLYSLSVEGVLVYSARWPSCCCDMSIMADISDKCDVVDEAGGEDDCSTRYDDDAPGSDGGGGGGGCGGCRELMPLAGTSAVSNVEPATDEGDTFREPSSVSVTTSWSMCRCNWRKRCSWNNCCWRKPHSTSSSTTASPRVTALLLICLSKLNSGDVAKTSLWQSHNASAAAAVAAETYNRYCYV